MLCLESQSHVKFLPSIVRQWGQGTCLWIHVYVAYVLLCAWLFIKKYQSASGTLVMSQDTWACSCIGWLNKYCFITRALILYFMKGLRQNRRMMCKSVEVLILMVQLTHYPTYSVFLCLFIYIYLFLNAVWNCLWRTQQYFWNVQIRVNVFIFSNIYHSLWEKYSKLLHIFI